MAESDLIRGNVDTVILKVLYEGDRYGYDLIKQINARGDGQWEIKQPTVYACLKRLEKQGFVTSYWDSSESDGGRRKYYSLTESGKDVFIRYKTSSNAQPRCSAALFRGRTTCSYNPRTIIRTSRTRAIPYPNAARSKNATKSANLFPNRRKRRRALRTVNLSTTRPYIPSRRKLTKIYFRTATAMRIATPRPDRNTRNRIFCVCGSNRATLPRAGA